MAKESQSHAFILICYDGGDHSGNLEALRNMPEVQEVHAVYGIYDEIARVKTETMDEFKILNSKIRAMPNIRSTITMFIE